MAPTLHFRRRHRLTHGREFQAAHRRGVKRSAGPLLLTAIPNHLAHARLGLSIGKRLGPAHVRNGFKRLLREAFRLAQHELPPVDAGDGPRGLDLVLSLRPHDPLPLEQYRAMLVQLAGSAAREWSRRLARGEGPGLGSTAPGPGDAPPSKDPRP